jgi:hypothetical protein
VHNQRRDVRRAARTRVRTRDLDQIQGIDLKPEFRARLERQEIDESKPGLGQHVSVERYCRGSDAGDGRVDVTRTTIIDGTRPNDNIMRLLHGQMNSIVTQVY